MYAPCMGFFKGLHDESMNSEAIIYHDYSTTVICRDRRSVKKTPLRTLNNKVSSVSQHMGAKALKTLNYCMNTFQSTFTMHFVNAVFKITQPTKSMQSCTLPYIYLIYILYLKRMILIQCYLSGKLR